MLQNHKALLVEVNLLADAEGAHQLIDSLGLLALALTDSLQVNIWVHLNDITSAYESTSASSCFKEGRHHPRLVRPLAKASLKQNFKLIRWLDFRASPTKLILFLFSLEDEFEQETKESTSLLDTGVEEHVEADVIVIAQGLQVLSESLAHLELMRRLFEVLRSKELHINKVILLCEHL